MNNLEKKKYSFSEGEESTEFGILASSIDISKIPSHPKPKQVRDELITMNQHGYMKIEWDEFGKDFAEIVESSIKPVMEIGCAYGWLTHRILERNKSIIAMDVSKEHLEVLLKDAPEEKLKNLFLMNASFPEEVDFREGSIGGIIASRIFHFLSGKEIERGLDKIHSWLDDEGKFVCTNCSIYHYSVKDKWLSKYKEREKAGEMWAGEIHNHKENTPLHAPYVPDSLNVFDIKQLESLLPKHGFEIEKIKLFDYPSDNYSEDNKGHIGFVARKVAKS